MENFSKIEQKFKRMPVRLIEHNDANGVLRLRGRKSRLEISSRTFLCFEPFDDNGWYDITVRSSDGRDLLLHHSITLNSGIQHASPDNGDICTLSILPNVVVDDLRGLSKDRKVRSIQFQLYGLSYFFFYQQAEKLRSYEATSAQIATLRSMRYTSGFDHGPFQPREIYVIHDFPVLANFRVGDRVYKIWSGGQFSIATWDRINSRTFPIAEIIFDELVSIETALDRVWKWRCLFTQMAMIQLPFEAISVRGNLDYQTPAANIYLPNLKRRPRPVEGLHQLSPRHLALNSWNDREHLQEAMRNWLERDDDRNRFRARVDRVIEGMNRRLDPRDLVDLGSAVDSLTELALTRPLPEGALDAMADAAHSEAERAKAGIARKRLVGLLGALQRPSLSARFASLGNCISPPLSAADAVLLAGLATRMRNVSAHGGALNDQTQPYIEPTVEALVALCVRFDLESSGFPSHTSADARTMSKLRFDEGLQRLQWLDLNSTRGYC